MTALGRDPPRLITLDDESPSLRAALREARAQRPSPQVVRAIAAGLGALLTPAAAAATASSSILVPAKILAIVAGSALVVGGIVWVQQPTTVADRAAEHLGPLATAADRAVEPQVPAPAPETEEGVVPGAESAVQRKLPPPAVRPHKAVSAAEVVPPEPAMKPSEAALLDSARAALAADQPQRALELTDVHRKQYPHGLLAQEREVIAVQALRRLGRSGDADSRQRSFDSAYPSSIHGRRVEVTPPRPEK